MRVCALRPYFALVLTVTASLILAPACCPNETDVVPLVFDGGIPDSATGDMGCAQFCYDTLGPPATVKLHRCDEFVNSAGNGVVSCYVDRLQCE